MPDYGTYVKAHPTTGREMERTPSNAAEVVSLEFDGWRKKSAKTKTSSTSSGSSSTGKSSNS